jgi:hypothetical protein
LLHLLDSILLAVIHPSSTSLAAQSVGLGTLFNVMEGFQAGFLTELVLNELDNIRDAQLGKKKKSQSALPPSGYL